HTRRRASLNGWDNQQTRTSVNHFSIAWHVNERWLISVLQYQGQLPSLNLTTLAGGNDGVVLDRLTKVNRP
ncbi:MAG: hypothetical protein J7639_13795, partial [Paenibacillaceae bacterium]|nr:hypothetical protein [Paenibacillaceae bacterium]